MRRMWWERIVDNRTVQQASEKSGIPFLGKRLVVLSVCATLSPFSHTNHVLRAPLSLLTFCTEKVEDVTFHGV
jgi:hypothetical protein